jgi:hypothetical protein
MRYRSAQRVGRQSQDHPIDFGRLGLEVKPNLRRFKNVVVDRLIRRCSSLDRIRTVNLGSSGWIGVEP